jgi:hypothetical protein
VKPSHQVPRLGVNILFSLKGPRLAISVVLTKTEWLGKLYKSLLRAMLRLLWFWNAVPAFLFSSEQRISLFPRRSRGYLKTHGFRDDHRDS